MKRRAFILLEALAHIAIYFIITAINYILIINIQKSYYTYIDYCNYQIEMCHANLAIDRLINEEVNIIINEESIRFNYKGTFTADYNELTVKDNKLIITYYRSYDKKTNNEILSGVDSINVINKNKVNYLVINKKGQRYIKCLETKRIKEVQ